MTNIIFNNDNLINFPYFYLLWFLCWQLIRLKCGKTFLLFNPTGNLFIATRLNDNTTIQITIFALYIVNIDR